MKLNQLASTKGDFTKSLNCISQFQQPRLGISQSPPAHSDDMEKITLQEIHPLYY